MNWPSVKISGVCALINGRAYKQHELLPEGKYAVLRVGNFFSNKDWYYSGLELPEDKYCEHGDLLYAWSASFGPRIWDGEKVIYHYHIWKVVIDENLIDKKYLFYALQNDVESIKREQGTGSTMIHVTKAAMEDRLIPLPPLPEQKRIAAILDKADAIRRKRQQAIQLADDFLRAVFLDMFGDPVTNPKGFKKAPVTELADVITGFAFKSNEYVSDSKDSIRLCRGTNTLTGYFDWSDTAYWPKNKLEKLEGYLIREGDVILAMDRPWISSGLKVCIFPRKERSTYLVQRVARLRPRDLSYSDYIYSCIKSKAFEKHCCPTETTVPHISPVELKSFEILIPDPTLLQKYHSVVSALAANIQRMSDSKEESEDIFSAISQKAFSGQI